MALMHPDRLESEKWSTQELKNMFEDFTTKNGDDAQNPEDYERLYLEYLKRIVFKLAICSEHMNYFVHGKVLARQADLTVDDANIQHIYGEVQQDVLLKQFNLGGDK